MIDNGRKRIIPNEVLLPEVARGNSMNPFLVDRSDSIVLGPYTDNDLQLYTVVLARDTNGRIVFHRITRRNGKELTLQGDGNIRITEQTSVDDVMGIMIAAIRKEKEYPCNGRIWQRYSFWWLKLTPVRRWLLAIFRRIRRVTTQ